MLWCSHFPLLDPDPAEHSGSPLAGMLAAEEVAAGGADRHPANRDNACADGRI
jgi:hypothetical protein